MEFIQRKGCAETMKRWIGLFLLILSLFSLSLYDVSPVYAATGSDQKVKKKILVVLVDFKDRKGKYQPKDFKELLFSNKPRSSTYTGSFRGYYQEVSKGKLDIDGDVIGWYHAPENHDYYSNDSGENLSLITWTLEKIYYDVNFADYDADRDGIIDGLIIVHQGVDGASVAGDGLISSFNLSLEDMDYIIDGLILPSICLVPELSGDGSLATIGPYVHEFGHTLGLPDLYDYDHSSTGIGVWDVMGTGNYVGRDKEEDSPTLMSAWIRKKMGWTDVIELDKSTQNVELNKSVIFEIKGKKGESFLLEHRGGGNESSFDEGLPEGVAIWHVDEGAKNGNDDENGRRLVALEQADGKNDLEKYNNFGDEGDLFTSKNQIFSDDTNPSSRWNNGKASGIIISNFTRVDNETMTFDVKFMKDKLLSQKKFNIKKLDSIKAKLTGIFGNITNSQLSEKGKMLKNINSKNNKVKQFENKIAKPLENILVNKLTKPVQNKLSAELGDLSGVNKKIGTVNKKLSGITKNFNKKLSGLNKKIGSFSTQISGVGHKINQGIGDIKEIAGSYAKKIGGGLRGLLGI